MINKKVIKEMGIGLTASLLGGLMLILSVVCAYLCYFYIIKGLFHSSGFYQGYMMIIFASLGLVILSFFNYFTWNMIKKIAFKEEGLF